MLLRDLLLGFFYRIINGYAGLYHYFPIWCVLYLRLIHKVYLHYIVFRLLAFLCLACALCIADPLWLNHLNLSAFLHIIR